MSDKSRELELHTIKEIMKTSNGRDFIHRCLTNTLVNESVFHKDERQHILNSGKREHGLWLQRELKEACPEYYLMMIKENDYE